MNLPLVQQAATHHDRIAIIDDGGAHTYAELLDASHRVASILINGPEDLSEARVAFMVPPGIGYAAVQWGVWRAGGVAVPLCLSHPLPEIEYVLDDTGATILVVHPDYEAMLHPAAEARGLRLLRLPDALVAQPTSLPIIDPSRRAMMLYTSGTTSKPKGVVSTHANIAAMVTALIEAWEWTEEDHILHVLPLHHTHGIVNVLLCALWAGATCEMLPKFDAEAVWQRFVERPLSLFMAVPTIYNRLIRAWEVDAEEQQRRSEACHTMRLMVSGSAALPVSVLETWETISGHRLLERYGMTETGMILTNPLNGERRPGSVGQPVPGMQVRMVDEVGEPITDEHTTGHIQVRGPSVFGEYWQRPEATAESFTADGWFKTGDVAILEDGYYRLLGRDSVDIIKTGGEKVSALEIEEVLRQHPAIGECAVVGVPDVEWGEAVCAAVVSDHEAPSLDNLRSWAKERLAPFKVPTRLLILDALPRNVMGKVTKPAVKEFFTVSKEERE